MKKKILREFLAKDMQVLANFSQIIDKIYEILVWRGDTMRFPHWVTPTLATPLRYITHWFICLFCSLLNWYERSGLLKLDCYTYSTHYIKTVKQGFFIYDKKELQLEIIENSALS